MSKNQRRKGNLQTANRARAVELLQTSGINIPFIGLETSTLGLPNAEGEEILDNLDLAPEFRIVLKKLTKRDALTREKAIKEMIEMAEISSPEQQKLCFQYFAQLYQKLVTDLNSGIRAGANNILSIYLSMFRNETPNICLKQTLPFLLFSTTDHSNQVVKSTNTLLNSCFPKEKKELLLKNFSEETIKLALDIVNRRHKLLQPQQSSEEESKEQRQSRLIAQSLKCIDALMGTNPIPSESPIMILLSNTFTQPSSLSPLMSMETNVRAAVFSLLKRLLQINPQPFLAANKLSSALLNHLDSPHNAICRNAFDCFLLLAQQDKFFEICSLEKAIIPKFLSLIRKKESHWNILETALLPALALIFNRIDHSKQANLALSISDSFFDGSIQSISLASWNNAFIEFMKYWYKFEKFNEDSKIITGYFDRVKKLIDFLIKEIFDMNEQRKLAEFIAFLQRKILTMGETESAIKKALLSELEDYLLPLLPKSGELLENLLDLSPVPDHVCSHLLTHDLPNRLLIKSVNKSSPAIIQQVIGLPEIISLRIKSVNSTNSELANLVGILCRVLIATENTCSLPSFIDLNDVGICLLTTNLALSEMDTLLDHCALFSAICTIFNNTLKVEKEFQRYRDIMYRLLEYICEKCSDSEQEKLLKILASHPNLERIPKLINMILEYYHNKSKISITNQELFAEKIFLTLLNEPEMVDLCTGEHVLLIISPILRQFHCDYNKVRGLLHQFLRSENDPSRIKKVAASCRSICNFKNTTSLSLFLPNHKELMEMASTLDYLFSTDLLSRNPHFLLPFCLLHLNHQSDSDNSRPNSDLFGFLSKAARYALFFACQIDPDASPVISELDGPVFCYLFIISTLINDYKLHTSHSKEFKRLLPFSRELNCQMEKYAESVHKFPDNFLLSNSSSSSDNDFVGQFPFCALYSLISSKKVPNIQFSDPQLQSIILLASQDHSSNRELPQFLDFLTGASDKMDDHHFEILHWLAEFHWHSATFVESNRAEHFVFLAQFLERHRLRIEEWLFTVTNDLIKTAFSCAVLNFSSQIIPFLAEVDGPIRDFINCGLITSLQNCRESFFDEASFTHCGGMNYLLGHFSLILIDKYENCIRINGSNPDYTDIRQEWSEFFGPSVSNYVVHWFCQLAFKNNKIPQFFVKSLCGAIHSIESDHLLKVELPAEFVQLVNNTQRNCPLTLSELFDGYPPQLRSILIPSVYLFFDQNPAVQFACGSMLRRFFFQMFSQENEAICKMEAGKSEEKGEEDICEGEEEEEKEREEELQVNTQTPAESRLPAFFERVLSGDFDTVLDGESEIYPPLLAFDILIRFLADLDVLSRVRYCDAFQPKILSTAFAHLFNSLSDPPGEDLSIHLLHNDDLFAESFHHRLLDRPFHREHFVCNLYYRTLATVPALFRDWYGTLGKTEAMAVTRYTQKYVSHLVIQREFRHLENMKRGKLEIRLLPKVREVECTYRLDESAMRLTILLPENYPLMAPKVETNRSIVSKELHRKWLLQLGLFLNRQNGAMLDGLLQWKRSIDQHLRGVEDCTICMSTVSSTNYQLPKIRCRQCKKKFHGDCLYKWFQTSSQSSCPLCRANFI